MDTIRLALYKPAPPFPSAVPACVSRLTLGVPCPTEGLCFHRNDSFGKASSKSPRRFLPGGISCKAQVCISGYFTCRVTWPNIIADKELCASSTAGGRQRSNRVKRGLLPLDAEVATVYKQVGRAGNLTIALR